MKNDTSLVQELTLPSRGFLTPGVPEGKLVQRAMMVRDQKKLASLREGAVTAILQDTVTDPEGFDVLDLPIADTIYLLLSLRILSYGKEYRFYQTCPSCGERVVMSVDLSTLEVTTLEEDFRDHLVVDLPHTGDRVTLRVLTERDQNDIKDELDRRRKRNKDDDSEYVYRIASSIDSIDLIEEGTTLTHPIDIERYVESLTGLDAITITDTRDSILFGVNPEIVCTCPSCNKDVSIIMPFTGDFFRPSTRI